MEYCSCKLTEDVGSLHPKIQHAGSRTSSTSAPSAPALLESNMQFPLPRSEETGVAGLPFLDSHFFSQENRGNPKLRCQCKVIENLSWQIWRFMMEQNEKKTWQKLIRFPLLSSTPCLRLPTWSNMADRVELWSLQINQLLLRLGWESGEPQRCCSKVGKNYGVSALATGGDWRVVAALSCSTIIL